MPAEQSKSRIFTQVRNSVILRMIKIIATGLAVLAFVADDQIDK